jgi:ankyrin repeat protein
MFFGLGLQNRLNELEQDRGGLFPHGILPIADCSGDMLCLRLTGPERGQVLYWKHDLNGYQAEPLAFTAVFAGFNELLAGLFDPTEADNQVLPELWDAVSAGDIESVLRQVEALPQLSERVQVASSVAQFAASDGKSDLVVALLPWVYWPAVLVAIAIQNDDASLVQRLLDRQTRPDAELPDLRGMTLLHEAVLANAVRSIEVLIAKGADLNAKNEFGQTPLKRAKMVAKKATIELLIRHGAVE